MQVDYLIQEDERLSVPKIMLMAGQWGVDVIKVIKPLPFKPSSDLSETISTNRYEHAFQSFPSIQPSITTLGSILDFSQLTQWSPVTPPSTPR